MAERGRVPVGAQRIVVGILLLGAAGVVAWAGVTYLLWKPSGSRRDRIPREAAEQSVRTLIFSEKPGMNPAAVFPIKEITTDDVWSRLHLQIFQVTEGVQMFETFILDGKSVRRIGRGFGGNGVLSTAVADLNDDGNLELTFTFSWGSGTHRSELGIFDPKAPPPSQFVASDVFFGNADWTLERADDRTVRVLVGKTPIGNVRYDPQRQEGPCRLSLAPALPGAILRQIRQSGG